MIVVPWRWWQTPSGRHKLVTQGPDGLLWDANDALYWWHVGEFQRARLEKARADDSIGFWQGFEHGRRCLGGIVFTRQKDRFDAQLLAGLDRTHHLDELVAPSVPREHRPLRPELLGQLGGLIGHELLLVLRRPFRTQGNHPDKIPVHPMTTI